VKNLDNEVWEFLQDDRFMKWIHSPDEGVIAYWEAWMEEHPDRTTTLFKAREIARDLAYIERPAGAEQVSKDIWNGVLSQLKERAPAPSVPLNEPRSEALVLLLEEKNLHTGHNRKAWYWIAACLAALLLAGGGLSWYRSASHVVPQRPQVANLLGKEGLQRANHTTGNQEVYLVDGSRIVLQPGSSIRHAAFLRKDKREIYLEGNAFFDVAKDARRPFYVYTKDLVVRVLGTSFNVTTDQRNGDVTVLVQTGKVAVSKMISTQQELVLEPNQQVLYRAGKGDLAQFAAIKQGMGPLPVPVAPAILFNFEEMPVTEIFKILEKAYGIPLFYEEKTFSACVVTTSLTNETFEEKLKIICEAIGATYRINDNGVSIEGKPCTK